MLDNLSFFETQPAPPKLATKDVMAGWLIGSKTAVVLDIETTGLSLSTMAEIIEIGAVRIDLETKQVIGKFSELVYPTNSKIGPKIQELTGITPSMVENHRTIEDVLPDLFAFVGSDLIICHNAAFDWVRFIGPLMKKVGLFVNNNVVCTMMIHKLLNPDQKKHNLAVCCEEYGFAIKGHHRAFIDAKYTASVACRMREQITVMANDNKLIVHAQDGVCEQYEVRDIGSDVQVHGPKVYVLKPAFRGSRAYFKTSYGDLYYSPISGWGFSSFTGLNSIDIKVFAEFVLEKSGNTMETLKALVG